MKAHTDYLWFETTQRKELVNITRKIEESGLKEDLMDLLERLAPVADYRHHRTGEDNGDAHLKRTLIGAQTTLPVTKGKLDLGPWEQVFYAEFDGRRRKRVVVKVLGA